MATRCFARSLLPKLSSSVITAATASAAAPRLPSFSLLRHRSISTAAGLFNFRNVAPTATTGLLRAYSSLPTTSSLQDNNPNWSTRPPKETILLDGCDFEHWLVVLEKPEGEPTRDEIIDIYVKTLAQITGSEEEARAKIYSVSTRCYYAFGCLISEELTYKMKELPKVRWVLPDSYLDVRNKDYGGEPFINGQAVPYDPKYHEEWIRNNSRANERNRRNDRPRNSDRSRNFERRRENMENRDFNRTGPPNPAPNMGGMPPQNNMGGPPQNMGGMPPQNNMGGMPPQNNMRGPPQNMGGMPPQNNMRGPPQNMGGMPPQNNMGGMPPRNMGGPPQNNMGGIPPHNNMGGIPPQNNMRGPPQNNMEGPPQGNMGGWASPPPNNMGGPPPPNNMGRMPPPNNAWSPPPNNMGGMPPPNNMDRMPPPHFQNNNGGNPPSGGGNGQYQNSYAPDMSGGGVPPYQR